MESMSMSTLNTSSNAPLICTGTVCSIPFNSLGISSTSAQYEASELVMKMSKAKNSLFGV